jgi:UDPglucose--hexose-1-phosphate uridylyltransferase
MHELRKDPIVDRWVIFSPERSLRPNDFQAVERGYSHPPACPFCAGNENATPPEILAFRPADTPANTPGWTLRVVPNKYPALLPEGETHPTGDEWQTKMNTIGSHEIIIETPHHKMQTHQLSIEEIAGLLQVFQMRLKDLADKPGIEYILLFKNQGEAAGATREHGHWQLITLPLVPASVREKIIASEDYFASHDACIYCQLAECEEREKHRQVIGNNHFICICPYASRFPFEMLVLPKFHPQRYEDCDQDTITALATILKKALTRMQGVLKNTAFNLLLHTAPVRARHDGHWHLEIIPRSTTLAGFELGTGHHINPTLPEDAAATLRDIATPL